MNESAIHNNKDIIFSLISKSKKLLLSVKEANRYEDMSSAKNRMEQQVVIKNICENCRSALDYCFYYINNDYSLGIDEKQIYFPFSYKSSIFIKIDIVKAIKIHNEKLYNYLYSMQPFVPGGNYWWLKRFIELNNKYKHQGFIPLKPFFKTKTFGWTQFGDIGISVEEFSFNVTENKIPVEKIDFKSDRTIEFEFRLEDNKTSVVNYMNMVLEGIEQIINNIFMMIENTN